MRIYKILPKFILAILICLPSLWPIQPAKAQAPNAPSNLRVVEIVPTRVKLAWNDNSQDEGYFKVEEYKNSSFSQVGNLINPNTTLYEIKSLSTYGDKINRSYRVSACIAQYCSPSKILTASFPQFSSTPAPSNLVATPSANQFDLTWQDNSSDELGFAIEWSRYDYPVLGYCSWPDMSTNFCPFLQQGQTTTVGSNVNTYHTILNTYGNQIYYFRVKTFSQDGYSDYSNIALGKTLFVSGAPLAPINFQAAPQADRINLSWQAQGGSPAAAGYLLERSLESNRNFVYLKHGSPVMSYEDTTAIPGLTYFYRIKYYNFVGGDSDFSNVASAQVPLSGAPPNIVISKIAQSDKVDVGGIIQYVITVTNSGEQYANNVEVQDTIMQNAVPVSGFLSYGEYDGSKITWNLKNIAPGESQDIWFQVWAQP